MGKKKKVRGSNLGTCAKTFYEVGEEESKKIVTEKGNLYQVKTVGKNQKRAEGIQQAGSEVAGPRRTLGRKESEKTRRKGPTKKPSTDRAFDLWKGGREEEWREDHSPCRMEDLFEQNK